ncbi:hypothetical protein H6G65_19025 [Microcystis elabens FACHB-917]|nr:hypothetical protein [Microcystis elabens FACHB-917]
MPGAISFPEFHSLRNIAAIPFWCILSSLLLQQLMANQSGRNVAKGPLSLAVLITVINLFGLGAFQYMVADNSFLAKAQQGPSYAGQSREYFQYNAYIHYHSKSDHEIIRASKGLSTTPSTDESRVIFEYYSRGLNRLHGPVLFISDGEKPKD